MKYSGHECSTAQQVDAAARDEDDAAGHETQYSAAVVPVHGGRRCRRHTVVGQGRVPCTSWH